MTLAALIKKGGLKEIATANPAKAANPEQQEQGTLAKLATLALAEFPKAEPEADERAQAEARRQRVISMLENNPVIRYGMTANAESDPEAAIVTLAIRDLGYCELAIPKAKYDAFKVLRMIEGTRRQGG